jgi:hypothetical protein
VPTRVAKIDAVFSIDGIGTVVALPKEADWQLEPKEPIHRRERIQIRTPGGGCISTYVREFEMINRGRAQGSVAFSLPRSIRKEDVPEGSELWLERDGTEPVIEP